MIYVDRNADSHRDYRYFGGGSRSKTTSDTGRARDAQRKVDLTSLNSVFSIYLLDNGEYPWSANSTNSSCPRSWYTVCGVNSKQTAPWISGLVDTYITSLPIDPINNYASYPFYTGIYSYRYGEVYSGSAAVNRETYDLMARLENVRDPDACAQNTGTMFYRWWTTDVCVPPFDNGWWWDMEPLYQAAPRRRP